MVPAFPKKENIYDALSRTHEQVASKVEETPDHWKGVLALVLACILALLLSRVLPKEHAVLQKPVVVTNPGIDLATLLKSWN